MNAKICSRHANWLPIRAVVGAPAFHALFDPLVETLLDAQPVATRCVRAESAGS
jgi:hypothetical protein